MKNLETTEQETNFIHLPKEVHEEILRNSVQNKLMETIVQQSFPDFVTGDADNIYWLLGLNPHREINRLDIAFSDIFKNHLKANQIGSYNHKEVKSIIKELRLLVELFRSQGILYDD